MHPFKPLMRKMIVIYAIAVAMVVVYFILRLFFSQDKAIELREFNTKTKTMKDVQKDKEEQHEEETGLGQKFMLLPHK